MSEVVGRAYDSCAEVYAKLFLNELDEDAQSRRFLDTFVALLPETGDQVLDLGCGPGSVVHYLSARGVSACGLDISTGQIQEARRACPDLVFEQGDMTNLHFATSAIKGISAKYAIIHLPPRELASEPSTTATEHPCSSASPPRCAAANSLPSHSTTSKTTPKGSSSTNANPKPTKNNKATESKSPTANTQPMPRTCFPSLDRRSQHHERPNLPGSQLHGHIAETALSAQAVANIIKKHATRLGYNAHDFAGHSLRRGFSTEASRAGAPERTIARTTHDTSTSGLNPYIADADLFTDPPKLAPIERTGSRRHMNWDVTRFGAE